MPGLVRTVAILSGGSEIIIGGFFEQSDQWSCWLTCPPGNPPTQSFNGLARIFGTAISRYGAPDTCAGGPPCLSGSVWAVNTAGTRRYVGGEFDTIGINPAVAANNVAYFTTGSESSANKMPEDAMFGGGVDGRFTAISSGATTNTPVYVGGDFLYVDGNLAPRIAKWNP